MDIGTSGPLFWWLIGIYGTLAVAAIVVLIVMDRWRDE